MCVCICVCVCTYVCIHYLPTEYGYTVYVLHTLCIEASAESYNYTCVYNHTDAGSERTPSELEKFAIPWTPLPKKKGSRNGQKVAIRRRMLPFITVKVKSVIRVQL